MSSAMIFVCYLQFVEIKGSVFKKFEKNNLFQMSNSGKCSKISKTAKYKSQNQRSAYIF